MPAKASPRGAQGRFIPAGQRKPVGNSEQGVGAFRGRRYFGSGSRYAWSRCSVAVKLLTMTALAFIMIHVGREFENDKSRLRACDSVSAELAVPG